MRPFGGILLIIGCILPVIGHIWEEKRRIRLIQAVSHTLDSLRRRLMTTAPDMDTLLRLAAEDAPPEARDLFTSIRLEHLDEQPFAAQWSQAVEKLIGEGTESSVLVELGKVLGQCPIEEQCQSLERATHELRELAQTQEARLREGQRLWMTLSASTGGILVLLLL